MAEKTATKKKSVQNPNCPVPGCRTKAPHASDSAVASFIRALGDPSLLALLARDGMAQLLISMQEDWKGKRTFAWFCRIRQWKELLCKTLYGLFFASEKELHHMISGERPNSIVPYYTTVNDELYAGGGKLTEKLSGRPRDSVRSTALGMLHSGAHTAFSALITGYNFAKDTKWQSIADKIHRQIASDVDRLDWIHWLFKKGLTKEEVLNRVKDKSDLEVAVEQLEATLERIELEELKAERKQGGSKS